MPAEPQILEGLGVSQGIAIGRAVCVEYHFDEVYRFPLPVDRLDDEVERLEGAVQQAERELRKVHQGKTAKKLRQDIGGILEAHILLLKDRTLLDRIERRIRDEHVNAEWAVHRTTAELAAQFEGIADDYLRGRNQDLLDVGYYLLRALQGVSHHELSEIEGDIILVADDLPPAEAVRLGRNRVVGFAIGAGGRTSHTTIIARSLKVPAVSALENVTTLVTDEDPVIVDGGAGRVILHPTKEMLADYRQRQRQLESREEGLLATRDTPAVTRDGTPITLLANIDLPEEIEDAVAYGAQGIGLYRSEFLYIEKSPELPSEEEHLAIYRRLAEGVAPGPVIIRSYDLGGRKLARELMQTREENPVLGLRGIRLTMARPEIFRTQLRAVFRAAVDHDVRLMLPLVTSVEQVRGFRAFADQVLDELEAQGLPARRDFRLGVMIEVPAAVWISEHLAHEVSFFSIGTNDLIQYSLAVDRNNEHVADLYQPLHPAVLGMLRLTVESARAAGIEVGLCGEVAADPRLVPLLLGLGLRRLSVSPRLVPAVKQRIRSYGMEELEELARQCLTLPTAAAIGEVLDCFLSADPGAEPMSRPLSPVLQEDA